MNMIDSLISTLQEKIKAPLPGNEAQYKMAHFNRENIYPQAPPSDARIACVLFLLYPKNDQWHFVLIKRMSSKNPNDKHSGQVSFPGGQLEEIDNSLEDGAKREAEEEVGVKASDISIIGKMTDLYIPVSNFLVHPFIGYMDYTPVFNRQESEVKAIIEAPFSLLLDENTVQKTTLKIPQGFIIKDVPHYNIHGHVVWGATAMMISEFLEILKN